MLRSAASPSRLARAAAAGLALGACSLWFVLACLRWSYPFELEWQEGGLLQHLERLLAGGSVYAAPDLEFIAFPYPPLYPALAALPALAFGASLQALRAVSILATVVIFVLLIARGRRGSGSWSAGLLSAGLFAAAYRFCGAWYDVARPDATAFAWLLAAFMFVETRPGSARAAGGAVLATLAFLCKQSTLPASLILAIGLAPRSRRDAGVFGATLLVGVGLSTMLFDARSEGWYRWYVFEQLAGHPFESSAWSGYWLELVRALPIALGLSVWFAFRGHARDSVRRGAPQAATPALWAFVLGLFLAGWIGRLHQGGYDNVLLPAVLGLALVFGPAAHQLATSGALLGLVQFALLTYSPAAQLPTHDDREAGRALLQRLSTVEGDVFLPYHGYLARRCGKSGGPHAMAMLDLLRGQNSTVAGPWVAELEAALQQGRWEVLVLDDASWEQQLPLLLDRYRPSDPFFQGPEDERFFPVTGARWRPERFYRRR